MTTKHLARIKTGLLLGALAIISVFYFPDILFALMCGLVVSAAFWEWLSLINIKNRVYGGILLLIFWVGTLLFYHYLEFALQVATTWWLLSLMMLFIPKKHLVFLKNKGVSLLVCFVVLAPTWVAAVKLHQLDRLVLFYLIMLVSFADTAAYFVGSRFGKRLLMPSVSPKKSFEGLLGGLLVGSLAGLLEVFFMPDLSYSKVLVWIVFGFVMIFVSVLGDLFESLIKRLYDAKDSGSFLPGHGGILDRIDSQTAAMPIYLFILLSLNFFK